MSGPILFEGIAESLAEGAQHPERHPSQSAEFWHHMVFDMVHGRASPSGPLEKTQGEFWMSRRAMNMLPLYVYCSQDAKREEKNHSLRLPNLRSDFVTSQASSQ